MIHEEKEPEQMKCVHPGIKRVEKAGENGSVPHDLKAESYYQWNSLDDYPMSWTYRTERI